jgi:hypothetical protein
MKVSFVEQNFSQRPAIAEPPGHNVTIVVGRYRFQNNVQRATTGGARLHMLAFQTPRGIDRARILGRCNQPVERADGRGRRHNGRQQIEEGKRHPRL